MDCNCKESVAKGKGQRSRQKYLVKCTPEMFVKYPLSPWTLNGQYGTILHNNNNVWWVSAGLLEVFKPSKFRQREHLICQNSKTVSPWKLQAFLKCPFRVWQLPCKSGCNIILLAGCGRKPQVSWIRPQPAVNWLNFLLHFHFVHCKQDEQL